MGIVDTLQTFTSDGIAVSNCIGIDIVIAGTFVAGSGSSILSYWISKVAIFTHIATVANISSLAVDAGDFIIQQLNTRAIIRTRTRFAIIRSTSQSITIETRCTALAVFTHSVVLADAASIVDIADIRVAIAVARDAPGQWATAGWFPVIARCTRLTELADIAIRTCALLDVAHLIKPIARAGRLKLDIVKETDSACSVCSTDLNRSDVGQQLLEIHGRQNWHPLVICMFMEPQLVVLSDNPGYWIFLCEDWC
jgi:hypothetical protein